MVPVTTTIACMVTLLISLVFPLLSLILPAWKHRKQGLVSAWLLGAAGFFVTQILIRMPILTALSGQSWFVDFSRNHVFGYAFTLAFTAGLFELVGRFAVAKLMQKRLTLKRSVAAGLGHGGIEAVLIVGITYINNLAYIAMINSGSFDSILAQAAASGVDISQLELIRTQLITMSPAMFLLAGLERILAMTGHLAMSLLVCYGVVHGKTLPCVLVCLGIHTLMDLSAGISLILPQTIAYPVIYTILTVMAVLSVFVIRELHRRWNKEVSYAAEE